MTLARSHKFRRILIGVAAILLFLTPARASSLDSYRERVESAASTALELEEELYGSEGNTELSRDLIGEIRRSFPQSERIEWSGGSVEVSNDWLLARVSDVEKESDAEKTLQIVVSIREYLAALSYKLSELQHTVEAGRSKDEDKRKLGEILRREEYQKPKEAESSALQEWLRKIIEWFLDLWPKPASASRPVTGMDGFVSVLRVLLYLVLLGLVGFLIYKVAPLLIPHLKRSPKPKKKSRVILGEQIAEDQAASDLFNEAEQLARSGDLRGAIRKGYIALLCDLSDRRIIGLARNKTNRDYLRDVRSRRDLHSRMRSVTDMFERHWYGYQDSSADDWTRFTEEYREAIKST